MDDSQDQVTSDSYNQASALTISNGALLIAVIFLFMVIIFVFLLYLYAKKYMGTYPLFNTSPQSQFIIVTDSAGNQGLDVAVLQSLPITVFHAKDVKDGLECSVCLSEVVEGEEARILPKCSHGFHLECIDMWFQSHSTCPLCRSAVGPDPILTDELDHESVPIPSLDTILREGYLPEHRAIPTNVLFWGTQNEITNGAAQETSSDNSGGTSGTLVIDIPRRAMENMSTVPSPMSPLPQSVMPLEDMKSPVSGRFRSLTRLLSMGKNIVGPSFSPSPRGGDIEQGFVHTPKTPKS